MKRLTSENAQFEARHQPSGLKVDFDDLSFADYVAGTRKMLFDVHRGAADPEKIVDGNAPFELKPQQGFAKGQGKPYKRGVLLTHGLTDSPYFMRHLAELFQKNGFRVMAILLPGHGTQPGDLLHIRWQQWAAAVACGVEQLSIEADEIYLAGYSTGGTLSVYHSLNDARVRGLFLFAPAFKISPLAAWANWHRLYSWLIPSEKWLSIKPDRDLYKYESVTKQAVAQTYALTRELHSQLLHHQVDIPVFIAASQEDTTVCTSATVAFIKRAQHPSSRMVLYSTDTEAPVTPSIERVYSVMPELRILSFSHTSIVIPACDPHYGAQGDYCNCQHYYPAEMDKYTACISHPEQAQLGELTPKNLAAGMLRRLTYNPRYAQLEAAMQQFIDQL